jgi:hypothetical protein
MQVKLTVNQQKLADAVCDNNRDEYAGFVSVKSLEDARLIGIETDPDDSEYPPKKYRGEWLHVNERGNCVLYYRNSKGKDRELASAV